MKQTVKVKIKNKELAKTLGVQVDSTVDVECKNDIPINREWRNRFKDAKTDNCIEVIKSKPKKEAK